MPLEMKNPWTSLPNRAPFVLSDDKGAIDSFNLAVVEKFRVDTTLLPDPYFGRPDSPVVLLMLNPGWSERDAGWHCKTEFDTLSRANLAHAPLEYPFYYLDPSLNLAESDVAPGAKYWREKLRVLIERLGEKRVAQNVLCIQYFPYHSPEYHTRTPSTPSVQYSFDLVRAAISRRAAIVVARSANRWYQAVPELVGHDRKFTLNSGRTPSISPNNCPQGFDEILQVITKS